MKKDNKFFDDFSKLASSAFASYANMRREFSGYIRQCVESLVIKMDFVKKEELDVVKKIALQTAKELEELKRSLNLEAKSDKEKAAPDKLKKIVAKKTAAKQKSKVEKS